MPRRAADPHATRPMRAALRAFGLLHAGVGVLLLLAALGLIVIATRMGWQAMTMLDVGGAQLLIEAVGYLAAAVVALQIAQTIVEEEVVRDAHISAPTRVRRFLSRFLVVLVVALAIEALVATFAAVHEEPAHLVHAAAMVAAVGLLLAGWGLFVQFNRAAEELEPEAMEEAKQEDDKLRE